MAYASLLHAILSGLLLSPILAHSHIAYLIINSLLYPGFDPSQRLGPNPANTIGWSTTASDDGFVPPINYTTPDIICHRDGSPALAHAPITAGDAIHVQWNGWPESHKGPILSYLASCNTTANGNSSGCGRVNKEDLRWFKIDESTPTLVNDTTPPGMWATDVMIAQNNSWLVRIPDSLPTGPYVLRSELIALHSAGEVGGAQNYPQCVNLWVEGGGNGTRMEVGVRATDMYHADDPGVLVDIYKNMSEYVIPGPAVVNWAEPVPVGSQTTSAVRGEGTPVGVRGMKTFLYT